ncbi:14269_t:CDS:2 [Funneliformis geosporum]|nr:14269_t:CDS:2 [Funneliformis geosporum]
MTNPQILKQLVELTQQNANLTLTEAEITQLLTNYQVDSTPITSLVNFLLTAIQKQAEENKQQSQVLVNYQTQTQGIYQRLQRRIPRRSSLPEGELKEEKLVSSSSGSLATYYQRPSPRSRRFASLPNSPITNSFAFNAPELDNIFEVLSQEEVQVENHETELSNLQQQISGLSKQLTSASRTIAQLEKQNQQQLEQQNTDQVQIKSLKKKNSQLQLELNQQTKEAQILASELKETNDDFYQLIREQEEKYEKEKVQREVKFNQQINNLRTFQLTADIPIKLRSLPSSRTHSRQSSLYLPEPTKSPSLFLELSKGLVGSALKNEEPNPEIPSRTNSPLPLHENNILFDEKVEQERLLQAFNQKELIWEKKCTEYELLLQAANQKTLTQQNQQQKLAEEVLELKYQLAQSHHKTEERTKLAKQILNEKQADYNKLNHDLVDINKLVVEKDLEIEKLKQAKAEEAQGTDEFAKLLLKARAEVDQLGEETEQEKEIIELIEKVAVYKTNLANTKIEFTKTKQKLDGVNAELTEIKEKLTTETEAKELAIQTKGRLAIDLKNVRNERDARPDITLDKFQELMAELDQFRTAKKVQDEELEEEKQADARIAKMLEQFRKDDAEINESFSDIRALIELFACQAEKDQIQKKFNEEIMRIQKSPVLDDVGKYQATKLVIEKSNDFVNVCEKLVPITNQYRQLRESYIEQIQISYDAKLKTITNL